VVFVLTEYKNFVHYQHFCLYFLNITFFLCL
jgi:hypothetical protein